LPKKGENRKENVVLQFASPPVVFQIPFLPFLKNRKGLLKTQMNFFKKLRTARLHTSSATTKSTINNRQCVKQVQQGTNRNNKNLILSPRLKSSIPDVEPMHKGACLS
jgi:hypothetical protein